MNPEHANTEPADELYTPYSAVAEGIEPFSEFFKDKVVFCNCDDPFESSFFQYFALNFQKLRLKKLITVSFQNSPVAGTQLPLYIVPGKSHPACKMEITEDFFDSPNDLTLEYLKNHLQRFSKNFMPLMSNGDFQSYECMDFLPQIDVAVTHVPQSRFEAYLELHNNYRKKFLLLGNKNLLKFPKIAEAIKQKTLKAIPCKNSPLTFAGYPQNSGSLPQFIDLDCCWFTNI